MMNAIIELCKKIVFPEPEISQLKGDLSDRKIFRVKNRERSLIAVSGGNTDENKAFLGFRDTLEQNNFSVPKLLAVSNDQKTYFLEDLGDISVKSYCDEKFTNNDLDAVKSVYKRIIEKLPEVQVGLYDKIDYSLCYQSKIFDKKNMENDLIRFEEFYLKKYLGDFDQCGFNKFKQFLIKNAEMQDYNYFMYRDFQTRNIMMMNNDLYFIDFQSGRKGSIYYDPASFIYSSNTIRYDGMEEEISGYYLNAVSKYISVNKADFKFIMHIFGCLRLMQAVGNYAYYYYTKNDKTIIDKTNFGLKTILRLSRNLNVRTGIYDG